MNLIQARRAVDYFNTIKTQDEKSITVGFIRNADDVAKYGGFCVRIYDMKHDEICEYYSLNHYHYKCIHEEIRTDFDRVYREHGHIFYHVD